MIQQTFSGSNQRLTCYGGPLVMAASSRDEREAIRIGITGLSCSGKTSVSFALKNLLTARTRDVALVHQDDFYRQDSDPAIPIFTFNDTKTGHLVTGLNWDTEGALDIERFR